MSTRPVSYTASLYVAKKTLCGGVCGGLVVCCEKAIGTGDAMPARCYTKVVCHVHTHAWLCVVFVCLHSCMQEGCQPPADSNQILMQAPRLTVIRGGCSSRSCWWPCAGPQVAYGPLVVQVLYLK